MQSSSLLQTAGGVTFLVGVAIALVCAKPRTQTRIHLMVRDISVLEALCCRASELLHSWPPPGAVAIDLSGIEVLDATSVARLDQACRRWSGAGIRLSIDGCNRHVVAALVRGGIDAEICSSERVSDFCAFSAGHRLR